MLVRFSNPEDYTTTTIDTQKWRAISMLQYTEDDANSYYVRLSFDNGETFTARKNMSLSEAINYRNLLEGYWYNGSILNIAEGEPPASA